MKKHPSSFKLGSPLKEKNDNALDVGETVLYEGKQDMNHHIKLSLINWLIIVFFLTEQNPAQYGHSDSNS